MTLPVLRSTSLSIASFFLLLPNVWRETWGCPLQVWHKLGNKLPQISKVRVLDWESQEHKQMLNDPEYSQCCLRITTSCLYCSAFCVSAFIFLKSLLLLLASAWEVREWDFSAFLSPRCVPLRWDLSSVSSTHSEKKTKPRGPDFGTRRHTCDLHSWSLSSRREMLCEAYSGIFIIPAPVPRNLATRILGMDDKARALVLSSLGLSLHQ